MGRYVKEIENTTQASVQCIHCPTNNPVYEHCPLVDPSAHRPRPSQVLCHGHGHGVVELAGLGQREGVVQQVGAVGHAYKGERDGGLKQSRIYHTSK